MINGFSLIQPWEGKVRKENYAERDRTRLVDSTETNGLCVGTLGTDNDRGRIVAEPAHCAATAVDLSLGRNRGELHSLLLRRSLRVDVLCRTDLGWIPTTRAVVGFFWAGVDGRRLPDPGNRGVDSVVSDAKLRGGNRVLQNGDRASRVVRCGHLGRKYESGRSDWNSRELIGRCFVVDVGGMAGVVACRAWASALVWDGGRRGFWHFRGVVSRSSVVATDRRFLGPSFHYLGCSDNHPNRGYGCVFIFA